MNHVPSNRRPFVLALFLSLLGGLSAHGAEVVRVELAERRLEAGQRTVVVSVYSLPEGGVPLATETRSARVGADGAFAMPLGELARAASGSETRWLGVRVTPGKESRRVPLTSAVIRGGVTVHVVTDAAITANGLIESVAQGFRFPDGTVQTSAATVSGGVPSVNGIGGAVTIAGDGTASVQTAGGTITITTPLFGSPVSVGSSNDAGAAGTMARSDHVHAHGEQSGGTLHATATVGSAGFLSAADKEKLDETITYVRTVVVSPVVGDPVASGTALLSALSGISGNSASNPFVLKIEPGIYDIGANALTMKTFVDVEGSGENATFIVASRGSASLGSSSAAVAGAASSELRRLTVTNTAPSTSIGIGYFTSAASCRLSHVTVNSTGASQTSIGILESGGSLTLSAATVTATSTGGTSGSAAIQLSSSAKALVRNSSITGKGIGGTGTNVGVNVLSSTAAATIEGCTILATGSAGQNNGVSVSPGTATITSSTVQVETSGTRTAVMTSASASSVLNVFHSRILALAPALTSSQASVSKGANSTLRIATSQVDSVSHGSPKCVHVYDSDMDDLNNACPAPIL